MNLINIYVEEVAKRLPEKNREDIILELRSTIEDMLPDDYNEDDEKRVLEKGVVGDRVPLQLGQLGSILRAIWVAAHLTKHS